MNSFNNMRKFFINGLKNLKMNYARAQTSSTINNKANIDVVKNPTNMRKNKIRELHIIFKK
jgi:hypothetical protein